MLRTILTVLNLETLFLLIVRRWKEKEIRRGQGKRRWMLGRG